MTPLLTVYNGVTYRSRLEARWAVVFESFGWSYVYEPEGFEHMGDKYLPDFWVDELNAYLAVKPVCMNKGLRSGLAKDLARQSEMIACGLLHYTIEGAPLIGRHRIYVGKEGIPAKIADCRGCDGISYVGEDEWGSLTVECCDTDRRPETESSPRTQSAFESAMRERFGELTTRGLIEMSGNNTTQWRLK